MSSFPLFLSTVRRLFPFFFIGLAITCLLLSLFSDAGIVRNFPMVHRPVIFPILITFFEAVLPLIFVFGLYKNISTHRSNTARVRLSEAIKRAFVMGSAGIWLLVFLTGVVPLATACILLDIYCAFSVSPLATSICGLIWICIGFWLLKPIRLAQRLILLALSLFFILAFKHIDWNSRRPFVRDLLKIESGMTANEVDRIMKRYTRGSSPANDHLYYMHKVKGPFYSDAGVVTLKNDKVEAVEIHFD